MKRATIQKTFVGHLLVSVQVQNDRMNQSGLCAIEGVTEQPALATSIVDGRQHLRHSVFKDPQETIKQC